MANRKKSEENT